MALMYSIQYELLVGRTFIMASYEIVSIIMLRIWQICK